MRPSVSLARSCSTPCNAAPPSCLSARPLLVKQTRSTCKYVCSPFLSFPTCAVVPYAAAIGDAQRAAGQLWVRRRTAAAAAAAGVIVRWPHDAPTRRRRRRQRRRRRRRRRGRRQGRRVAVNAQRAARAGAVALSFGGNAGRAPVRVGSGGWAWSSTDWILPGFAACSAWSAALYKPYVCWLTQAHQHSHAQCERSAACISGLCLSRCAARGNAHCCVTCDAARGAKLGSRGSAQKGCNARMLQPAGGRAHAYFGSACAAQVIDDVASMGFSRHEVRGVVTELMDSGQSIDLNIVLDRLMNGRR